MSSKTKVNKKTVILRWLLGLTILTFLLASVDMNSILASWQRIPPSRMGLSAILYFFAWAVASKKWQLLLPEFRFTLLLKMNFVAQFYSMALPGQIAGEIAKAYRLGKGSHQAERIAASILVDRLTGILGLLVLAVIGLIASGRSLPSMIAWALISLTLILLVGLWSVGLGKVQHNLVAALESFSMRGVFLRKLSLRLIRFIKAWSEYLTRPLILIASIIYGIVFQAITATFIMLIGYSQSIDLSFADWCWVFGIVSVVTTVPLTVGGIGLREGSFIGVLALVGTPAVQSLALSLSVFSLFLAGALAGGIIEWMRIRRSSRLEEQGSC